MADCFIITNQHGMYLSKQKEWVDGSEPQGLFRCQHDDEALNMVFEMSSKDIYLRAQMQTCELNDKKVPVVEVVDIPEELRPAPAEDEADQQDLEAEVDAEL
jgi:hypothetical protein